MAEKYYGVNAYSYCAGNPDGKDTWEIDALGKAEHYVYLPKEEVLIPYDEKKKTSTEYINNKKDWNTVFPYKR